jgi:dUTP pyrophosphatase
MSESDITAPGTVWAKIVPDDPKFIPRYQSDGAANADLVANLEAPLVIPPMGLASFDTGFKVQIPVGWKAEVSMRSGWAKRGLVLVNAPGQIDEDFSGRIVLNLVNLSHNSITINPGDRIAQVWPTPVYRFKWQVVTELDPTERGEQGFGSTGGMSP